MPASAGDRQPAGPAWPAPGSVDESYVDASGVRRRISRSAIAAVRASMGATRGVANARPDPVRLAKPGLRLDTPGELVLEDGTRLGLIARLPRDLPPGYHRLLLEHGEQLLIAAPPRCYLPAGLRAWAWSAQLYATRSRGSWGIGDLADLRSLASWAAELGAGALLINPMGAPNPSPDPEPSPYYPSTRRYADPLLIAIDKVPGADRAAAAIAPLADEARSLNADRLIDRSRVLALKMGALQAIWDAGGGGSQASARRLEAFRALRGPSLRQWATFVMLSERLGAGWRAWPAGYRDPSSTQVALAAARDAQRVAFHEWIQWLIDEQLATAARSGPLLITDLPVGFDPGGFDAWTWQESLASGISIGAPPDPFSRRGQDWGLPPFIPHRLRQDGYRPFIETLRAAMRHAGGLRIDHILGLFRLWWVPQGRSPARGAYVRNAADELLAILAIESHRASAVVIGEDLGVVERGVRQALRARNVLSTRLLYFERRDPAAYPRPVLAAVSTHDLPTVAGVWSGADLADQARTGLIPNVKANDGLRAQLERSTRLGRGATAGHVVLAAYGRLARSKAALVAPSLEDAGLVEERPNVPGTSGRHRPNWSLALPMPIEQLRADPFAAELAQALRR
ncbi:MAG: 4-alpha-glucanotransferase [Chloroflexi bacterium]|nr:MAG: 4-alpha-glucanotransferase [Chloroflexota bacterium]